MRRVAVVLVGLLFGFLGITPAHAHAELSGFGLDTSTTPSVVRLTFTEDIAALGLTVVVLDPEGRAVQVGDPLVDRTVVTVALQPFSVAGDYHVNFRVLSADGHVVTGSNTFSVYESALDVATPSPVLTASAETSPVLTNDPTIAYWITGLLMLCGIIAAAVAWRAKR